MGGARVEWKDGVSMQDRTRAVGQVWNAVARWFGVAVTLSLFTAAAAASTSTVYANTTTPLLATAGGSSQGDVLPGTPLTVLGSSGSDIHVQIEGWVVKGSASVLFEGIGQHTVLATFTSSGKLGDKVLTTKKDAYGTTWQQMTFTGWVAQNATVAKVATVWKKAENLYDSRCSACHALHNPNEFTANQWPGILKVMGQNASLDQQDLNLVTRYLQAHAKAQ